ncbi:hypothetical protein [Sulfurovum mangrovi]|uniref:hypothetical protein n=1 Tax=Sulfurovum mangrovi TaxID=2893889 RepID=UPI001E400493|nr:hypothetical protein [Sulfurovum mangrovi]UFH58486.1 hypothetical protein LN246_08995 [Sulfurovum mangrovi]
MLIDKNEEEDYADYTFMMRREGYYIGYYGRTTPNQFENEIRKKLGNILNNAQAFSIDFYVNENFDLSLITTLYDRIDPLFPRGISGFYNTHFDMSIVDDFFEYEILLSGIEKNNLQ